MIHLSQRFSLLFCLCLVLFSCGESITITPPADFDPIDSSSDVVAAPKQVISAVIQNEDSVNLPEFKTFKKYRLTDTIVKDVNGDGVADKAFFTTNNGHRYMKIEDGSSHVTVAIGKDASFKDIGEQFDWIDLWGITEDQATHETLFVNDEVSGTKDVPLKQPSIVVHKLETGGGVIAYLDGRYQWIHQGD